ncbi:hypothetical protein QBC36DRAFT_2010 [Triangularia setosa]|uniref:Uncharacterized protein n=1 Tax=Triangularia setosa TaxID=2587417 RepID=A0AAN6WKT0_9PEZI|nr:hypothetical protein QBC36DRAFT_2010 [Podospora setosa]
MVERVTTSATFRLFLTALSSPLPGEALLILSSRGLAGHVRSVLQQNSISHHISNELTMENGQLPKGIGQPWGAFCCHKCDGICDDDQANLRLSVSPSRQTLSGWQAGWREAQKASVSGQAAGGRSMVPGPSTLSPYYEQIHLEVATHLYKIKAAESQRPRLRSHAVLHHSRDTTCFPVSFRSRISILS